MPTVVVCGSGRPLFYCGTIFTKCARSFKISNSTAGFRILTNGPRAITLIPSLAITVHIIHRHLHLWGAGVVQSAGMRKSKGELAGNGRGELSGQKWLAGVFRITKQMNERVQAVLNVFPQ